MELAESYKLVDKETDLEVHDQSFVCSIFEVRPFDQGMG